MSLDIPELCLLVLRKIFDNELERYKISIRGNGTKGEGHFNDMIFLDLEKDGETSHLALKMMPIQHPGSNMENASRFYETEVNFYENVWPELDTFQRSRKHTLFDKIPKYFASASKEGRTVIAMENVKADGFLLRRKKDFHDRNLVEFVFKKLAHFHAISFALKQHDPEQFDRVISSFKGSWKNMASSSFMKIALPRLVNLVTSSIKDVGEMKMRMQKLPNSVLQEFDNVAEYRGEYATLNHGDSWITNLLFKYNESAEIQDIRFVDFQLSQIGTPVYDLSYFLYSGADKDILEDLEHFLLVYHECLSSILVDMECDPDKLYPYQVLKEEWKEYSKFGFLGGILTWRAKTNEGVANVNDDNYLSDTPIGLKYDEELYSKATTDLVRHMYQNGFL